MKMTDYYIEIVRNLSMPMVLFLIDAYSCFWNLTFYKYLWSKMYGDSTKGTTTSVEGGEKTKIWLPH